MDKKAWVGLFFLVLLSELVSIQLQLANIRFVTKPLLVLVLLGYFLTQVKGFHSNLKPGITLALGFSWLGDVLLLFEQQASIFFILGLSDFLIAHLFYIAVFNKMRIHKGKGLNLTFLPFIGIYYSALLWLLHPHLGAMKLPVYVYGLVICGMLFLALHLYKISQNGVGRLLLIGAILFVLSDSVLAINKFYDSFTVAGIIIMLTYGLAQYCIVEGCIRWCQFKSLPKSGANAAI